MAAIWLVVAGGLAAGEPPALEWRDSPEVSALFEAAGVDGSFVLHDVGTGQLSGHDQARAQTRFVPASTFKIVNALIGLSTGAVKGVDEVFPWDGKPRSFESWERDMSLREAMPASNVPVYQELARRIGLSRMRSQVRALGYGNTEIGEAVDRFWLDGPLAISATEQVRFLAMLARGTLPVSGASQATVREILLLEETDRWRLYGKTGWANAPGPGIGWWVGWVERDDAIHAFALNLDIREADDAALRLELGRAALRLLGVLEDRDD